LTLEKQRQALNCEIDTIVERLNSLSKSLFAAGMPAIPSSNAAPSAQAARRGRPARRAVVAKPATKKGKAKRSSRGELKSRVYAALQSAGASGVYVNDLAKSLGTKPVNIHAWFHAALKRYPNIHKIAGGHYRLKGKGGAV